MTGVSDVASLGSLILACADKIQELGANWYKATAELKEFPGQVERLLDKVDIWEKEASNTGLISDPIFIKSLEDVKSSLEQERDKLEKRAARCGGGCLPRLRTTLFPVTLGESIQNATNTVDNIPAMLKLREESREALERARIHLPVPEFITSDSRYVPLQFSEAEIYSAINNQEGPAVVLFHGGPGKGKSTVARAMIVHYNDEQKGRFDHVFLLNCGPNAKLENTLFEIIRRLGSQIQTTSQDEEIGRLDRMRQQVNGLLENQKILLILDDVSDPEFLEGIVQLFGFNVKCLVTSRDANLTKRQDPSNWIKIKIQDIGQEDARRILASHVGFPNKQIPERVQAVADSLILKTSSNPLALASLANAIDSSRADDLDEWEDASANFLRALQSKVPAAVLHGRYSKSFWVTMGQTISTLTEDARKLLLLVTACEGPSVAEQVLHILYRSAMFPGCPGIFSNARSELENRQLINIINPALTSSYNLGKQRIWSVHSLQKIYIEKEMKEGRDFMFISLAPKEAARARADSTTKTENVEEILVTSLCALYLEKDLAKNAASKIGILQDKFHKFNYDLRRNAVEPITLLLGLSVGDRWTETSRDLAMKVVVAYIGYGAIDGESISYFLGLPIAAPAMWRALKDIAFIDIDAYNEDGHLVIENAPSFMKALVDQLAEGVEGGLQQSALEVLRYLAINHLNSPFIASSPGVLEGIVRILDTSSDSQTVLLLCSRILKNLAWNPSLELTNIEKMEILVDYPGVLDVLVNCVSKDANPALQEQAARALVNISCYASIKVAGVIVNHPRVLPEIVNSLSKDTIPALQRQAARVLANLSWSGSWSQVPTNLMVRIVNFPGVLSHLVNLVSKHDSPDLQHQAVKALGNLRRAVDYKTRMKINNRLSEDPSKLLSMDLFPMENHLEVASQFTPRAATRSGPGGADSLDADEREFEPEPTNAHGFKIRCIRRKIKGDLKRALADANKVINLEGVSDLGLQERGVLKQMTADLRGALTDFNEGLKLTPNDYEMLKHRGYVKFLMNDKKGARADAELALRFKPPRVDDPGYGKDIKFGYLGASSVEFLEYKLR